MRQKTPTDSQSETATADFSEILEVLSFNKGFHNPAQWIEYAKSHGFKRVEARQRENCPDCFAVESRTIGQFVYYSQLSRLKKCHGCGLIYSDVVLSENVIRAHFETAYKDIQYHEHKRRAVFNHVVQVVDRFSPAYSSLIDVGGGMGHLAGMVARLHPERKVVFSDISQRSCDYASANQNVETICSSIEDLSRKNQRFDVFLMIDVLYYVQDLSAAWKSISECLNEEAMIVLRVPNKIWWIELSQFLRSRVSKVDAMDRIVGMNPEHLYVFGHDYLRRKLRSLGFESVQFLPSQLAGSDNSLKGSALRILYAVSWVLHKLSAGRLCFTPSQLVVAKRKFKR